MAWPTGNRPEAQPEPPRAEDQERDPAARLEQERVPQDDYQEDRVPESAVSPYEYDEDRDYVQEAAEPAAALAHALREVGEGELASRFQRVSDEQQRREEAANREDED